MDKVITDIQYTMIQFSRSWQSVFFTLVFPILFLLLAWYMPERGASLQGSGPLDYAFPGIIGIAVMGSSLDLTVGFISNYRETGVLRKLAMTPLSRLEWNLARAAAGIIVALLSIVVSIVIAWLAFGVRPPVSIIMVLLSAAGSVVFTELGLLIAYLIKDGDTASAASFTITLPLILVSGALFPADRLPPFLQALTAISPLYYLNDGLRNATVAVNAGNALPDLAILSATGIVLFTMSIILLQWGDK
ncbi:MAG TPA: ABC transporter permease [Methanocella sp.]|nr:ABC transporter permease [Methanocella sp.]